MPWYPAPESDEKREERERPETTPAPAATEGVSSPMYPVPWPKHEDITQDMREGFERLYAEKAQADHSTLERNVLGAYRVLKVDADWVFYQRAWADALLASAPAVGASDAIAWSTGIVWGNKQSEMVVKLTRNAQSEYGFIHPLHAAPSRTPTEARNMLNAFINARTAFMDRREGSYDAYQKAQQEIIQALVR